jgi:transposase, IS30 family
MGSIYNHLTAAERTTLMVMRAEGASQTAIAEYLRRDRSTICRELARNSGSQVADYDAVLADARARDLRAAPATHPKLGPDTPLFAVVHDQLLDGWSPEQIAGALKRAFADDRSRRVCHETIYSAIYVMPRGDLRTDLISLLRQGHAKRRPRARGQDRRGQIADMVSLHVRPPEIEDRLIPGHWEGDLIKGALNRSCVGTLVERTSRLVLLAKVEGGGTADAALAGFSGILNRVHEPMRKTLTYDQGKEMSRHKDLTAATGVAVYFADPHSPWQRGSNENTNGLLRQYLPKGTDLSGLTQADLDTIARRLNTRPRKLHGFRSPIEVYAEHLSRL